MFNLEYTNWEFELRVERLERKDQFVVKGYLIQNWCNSRKPFEEYLQGRMNKNVLDTLEWYLNAP